MSTGRELSGVLPVIQTPFGDDDQIDEAALRDELEWVLDQGVAGLTTGMVSEVLRLNESERRLLNEVVIDVARAHGALSVVSCGAESTKVAMEYARHAEKTGADGIMVIAPTTVVLDDEALFEHYAQISDATSIALVVQDASGYVGRPISIALQARLLEHCPQRIYFKPEAPPIGQRLTALREATEGRARTFEGTGGTALVDSYRRGIVGTMPGAEVCWAVQAMWRALETNDWARAYAINGPLSLLINLQHSIDSFVAVEKHILQSQGVMKSTRVRGPVGYVLDGETREEVDRLVAMLRSASSSSDLDLRALDTTRGECAASFSPRTMNEECH